MTWTLIKNIVKKSVEIFQDILIQIYIWGLHFIFNAESTLYNTPIIINNFNRLTTTKELVDYLFLAGFKKIIILDNQSTFPPLLDYYKTTKAEVVYLNANVGHLSLWKTGFYDKYKWNYFVYTDSDVMPVEECPRDFLQKFYKNLLKHVSVKKVGFSIKIDDLPDHFHFKTHVQAYEQKYWEKKLASNDCFIAPIDTTFALYKPFTSLKNNEIYTRRALRVAPPYMIRHKPWYNNTSALNEEEEYYIKQSNSSSSIKKQISGDEMY